MTELLTRLSSVLDPRESGTVTPNRIRRNLDDPEGARISAEALFAQMVPEVAMEFQSNKGNPKEKKLKRFLRSLDSFLADYKPEDLIKMSEDCIDRDGKIIKEELDKLLSGRGEI